MNEVKMWIWIHLWFRYLLKIRPVEDLIKEKALFLQHLLKRRVNYKEFNKKKNPKIYFVGHKYFRGYLAHMGI